MKMHALRHICSCRGNRGSAAIEAAAAVPIFLFLVLFFISACGVRAARGVVYEAAAETAEYMAEYGYLTKSFPAAGAAGTLLAASRFEESVDDAALLEKYVVGGAGGVSFMGSSFPDGEDDVVLRVSYAVHVDIPVLGKFSQEHREEIRQHTYTGRNPGENAENGEEDEQYVYVTDQGTVYHTTRQCTYLTPEIHAETEGTALEQGYPVCRYCRSAGAGDGTVYVTSYGECYHKTKACSRLRRRVRRVRKSETSLPACSKCGG